MTMDSKPEPVKDHFRTQDGGGEYFIVAEIEPN